jgi:phosphoribosylanthranilate isomerase
MRTWVKICGLTTVEAVAASVEAGADAVGFVLAPGSPRTLDAPAARLLAAGVPSPVETVGVFRGQPVDEVVDLATRAGVRMVQLHGNETPADVATVRSAGFRVIRAVGVDAYSAESEEARRGFAEDALLIDAVAPGAGAAFDAAPLLAAPPHRDWILAGGLSPDTVADRIAELRPAGVDVSSGVESSRGVKDVALIRAFVAAARAVSADGP